jgi:hypothetical protein
LKSFQNPKTVGELTKTSIKLVNDKFFWHGSKTCTDCERPCKSLWILKIVGNSSQKWPQNVQTMSFWSWL